VDPAAATPNVIVDRIVEYPVWTIAVDARNTSRVEGEEYCRDTLGK
jgi:hypothetical protein